MLNNARMDVKRARRRLRNRRVELKDEVEELRERERETVKTARKLLKRKLARLEREWCGERIGECREVCERGRIEEMCSLLRKMGRRGRPTAVGTKITADKFKEHLRGCEVNDFKNEMSEREEIMEAIDGMKCSELGEDRGRIEYLKHAREEAK